MLNFEIIEENEAHVRTETGIEWNILNKRTNKLRNIWAKTGIEKCLMIRKIFEFM